LVTRRPSVPYQALVSLVTLIMLSSLLNSLSGFWRLELPGQTLLIFGLIGVGIGWLLWRSPLVALAAASLGIASGIVALRYLPTWEDLVHTTALEAVEFWENLHLYQAEATFGPSLGDLFLLLLAMGLATLIIRETFSRGSTFWSIAIGALIFGIQWSWYYDPSFGHFTAYTVMAFILWALGQSARRDAAWVSSGRRIGYRIHMVTPVAGILLIGLVATLLPYNFAVTDLGRFGERVQEAFPFLKEMRGGGSAGSGGGLFSLRSTGFSPTMGSLGGPVTLDHSVALQLQPEGPLTSTAYLRGASYLTYDGRSWRPGNSAFVTVPREQNMVTQFSAVVPVDVVTYEITPALNMGNTLFHMLDPLQVKDLKPEYKTDGDSNLWADRAIPRGTTYKVLSEIPQYSAEQIRRISTSVAPETFESHLMIPSSVPARVIDLASRLTNSADHPYDKAVLLERHFRGMPYSLNVPAVPFGRDFVDYFLFDLQRGYCTYFATAMVVMLRAEGIPSRLVEGFAVPASTQFTETADGTYSYAVLNSQAHAWVEAHFPGYGWVTFDPTPRADLPRIDRTAIVPVSTTVNPSDLNEGEFPLGETNSEFPDELEEGFGGSGALLVDQDHTSEWALVLVILLIGSGVLYLGYRRLVAQDRIAVSEERQVVQEAWVRSASLLAQFGVGRKPSQTPREFATALGQDLSTLKDAAVQVANDYTAARFAPPDRPVDAGAGERARTLWGKVQESLFDRYGWRTYLWRRLRWRQYEQ
jgi:transglutaminase-like putative cysteine protease